MAKSLPSNSRKILGVKKHSRAESKLATFVRPPGGDRTLPGNYQHGLQAGNWCGLEV